jgi:glucose-6-phosphate dehydrogenase assembly protein OpcA
MSQFSPDTRLSPQKLTCERMVRGNASQSITVTMVSTGAASHTVPAVPASAVEAMRCTL